MADLDPKRIEKPDAGEGESGRAKPGGPVLGGTTISDVTSFLAHVFVEQLGLKSCVLYLYDDDRTHLVRLGGWGEDATSNWPERMSVDHNSPLGAFEMVPGQPGGAFTIPLWDGRSLLGFAYGRMPRDRVFDDSLLSLSRAVARAGSSAVAVALASSSTAQKAGEPVGGRRGSPVPAVPNAYLFRHLAAVLRSASPSDAVAVALLRLSGPNSRGVLPMRGAPIPAPPGAKARSVGVYAHSGGPGRNGPRPTGRGFGFGGSSNAVALVWTGASREQARTFAYDVALGRKALSAVTGGEARGEEEPSVVAGALCMYPDDASSAGAMLAGVTDLLDLETYLVSADSKSLAGEAASGGTGRRSARVMDTHLLSAEIDRQRQALNEAIQGGGSFQDSKVREISERLDRLIVVMQRFMGYRGLSA